jgi:copper chaperone CopZ
MKKLLFGLMISAIMVGLLMACGGDSVPFQSPGREETATPTAARLERVTMQVPTFACGTCKVRIVSKLQPLAGVVDIEADLPTKKVVVTYDPAQVTAEEIVKAVEQRWDVVQEWEKSEE